MSDDDIPQFSGLYLGGYALIFVGLVIYHYSGRGTRPSSKVHPSNSDVAADANVSNSSV